MLENKALINQMTRIIIKIAAKLLVCTFAKGCSVEIKALVPFRVPRSKLSCLYWGVILVSIMWATLASVKVFAIPLPVSISTRLSPIETKNKIPLFDSALPIPQ